MPKHIHIVQYVQIASFRYLNGGTRARFLQMNVARFTCPLRARRAWERHLPTRTLAPGITISSTIIGTPLAAGAERLNSTPIFDLTFFHFLTGACLARVPTARQPRRAAPARTRAERRHGLRDGVLVARAGQSRMGYNAALGHSEAEVKTALISDEERFVSDA